jgi:hypothetical protein
MHIEDADVVEAAPLAATEPLMTVPPEVKSRNPVLRRFLHPLHGVEEMTFVVEDTASGVHHQHRTLNEDLGTCTKDKHPTLVGNMLQHTKGSLTMLGQAHQPYNMRPVRIHRELCSDHTMPHKFHTINSSSSSSSLERIRSCKRSIWMV